MSSTSKKCHPEKKREPENIVLVLDDKKEHCSKCHEYHHWMRKCKQGVPGPEGPPGPQGQSIIGPAGVPGPIGVAGPAGVPGPQGNSVVGPAGVPGPQGNTVVGPQGVQGPEGNSIIGPQGIAGPAGVPGPQGNTVVGPAGVPGPQGNTVVGPQGIAGPQGNSIVGPQGVQGPQGIPGPSGMSPILDDVMILTGSPASGSFSVGPSGNDYTLNLVLPPPLVGPAGASGPAGVPGPAAVLDEVVVNTGSPASGSFIPGPGGNDYTLNLIIPAGTAGPQGVPGPQGNTVVGPAGVAGPQGTQGPQGVLGPAGQDGTALGGLFVYNTSSQTAIPGSAISFDNGGSSATEFGEVISQTSTTTIALSNEGYYSATYSVVASPDPSVLSVLQKAPVSYALQLSTNAGPFASIQGSRSAEFTNPYVPLELTQTVLFYSPPNSSLQLINNSGYGCILPPLGSFIPAVNPVAVVVASSSYVNALIPINIFNATPISILNASCICVFISHVLAAIASPILCVYDNLGNIYKRVTFCQSGNNLLQEVWCFDIPQNIANLSAFTLQSVVISIAYCASLTVNLLHVQPITLSGTTSIAIESAVSTAATISGTSIPFSTYSCSPGQLQISSIFCTSEAILSIPNSIPSLLTHVVPLSGYGCNILACPSNRGLNNLIVTAGTSLSSIPVLINTLVFSSPAGSNITVDNATLQILYLSEESPE